MRVIEISVLRARASRAHWGLLSVYEGEESPAEPALPAVPAPTAPATDPAPDAAPGPAPDAEPGPGPDPVPKPPPPDAGADGPGFATGRTLRSRCPVVPHQACPADVLGRRYPVVRGLLRRAASERMPAGHWYVMADGDTALDPVREHLASALSNLSDHGAVLRAMAGRGLLSTVYSGRCAHVQSDGGSHDNSYDRLLAAVDQLASHGLQAPAIARCLECAGFTQAPGRADSISLPSVRRMLREDLRPIQRSRPGPKPRSSDELPPDEWWLSDLAAELEMPAVTLYAWIRRGWISHARKEPAPPHRWILRVDPDELHALRARRSSTGGP
ncbi:hypothetical protein [Streptomyces sedi]|uniref:hypothetical protein n=1 Tax=Streptomyces sedi TaxID=555059 RepID=UPI001B8605ED|nr:hypothetical protein [Streptomyces sedi]